MNRLRRSVLQRAAIALLISSVPGCLTRSGPGGTDDDGSGPDDTGNDTDDSDDTDDSSDPDEANDADDSDDDSEPDITAESFQTSGSCQNPESASIEWADESIAIEGCIVGRNGCADARLVPLTQTTADGTLDVVVQTFVDADDNEACTEVLINIRYELRLRVPSSGDPTRIQVTHDDVNGRSAVATTDRP
ncbi:hypothetical protein [Halalkalirubrum salinum]|uniref:hypothetical protein n=1 Tax=Halalkalirubrum salinum TaxID=2563889 RepID=UPI0010FB84CE|nr:hypothetical protein [Halalkalirubrum salinum]